MSSPVQPSKSDGRHLRDVDFFSVDEIDFTQAKESSSKSQISTSDSDAPIRLEDCDFGGPCHSATETATCDESPSAKSVLAIADASSGLKKKSESTSS